MNKKFLSAVLFGALMVTSTGTFVSCKDYDDDIDRIDNTLNDLKSQIAALQTAVDNGKWITNVEQTSEGLTITMNDGQTYKVTNGQNGAQGEPGAAGDKVVIDEATGAITINGKETGYFAVKNVETGDYVVPTIDKDGFWCIVSEEGKLEQTPYKASPISAVQDTETKAWTLMVWNTETKVYDEIELPTAATLVTEIVVVPNDKGVEKATAGVEVTQYVFNKPSKWDGPRALVANKSKVYAVSGLDIRVNPVGVNVAEVPFTLVNTKNATFPQIKYTAIAESGDNALGFGEINGRAANTGNGLWSLAMQSFILSESEGTEFVKAITKAEENKVAYAVTAGATARSLYGVSIKAGTQKSLTKVQVKGMSGSDASLGASNPTAITVDVNKPYTINPVEAEAFYDMYFTVKDLDVKTYGVKYDNETRTFIVTKRPDQVTTALSFQLKVTTLDNNGDIKVAEYKVNLSSNIDAPTSYEPVTYAISNLYTTSTDDDFFNIDLDILKNALGDNYTTWGNNVDLNATKYFIGEKADGSDKVEIDTKHALIPSMRDAKGGSTDDVDDVKNIRVAVAKTATNGNTLKLDKQYYLTVGFNTPAGAAINSIVIPVTFTAPSVASQFTAKAGYVVDGIINAYYYNTANKEIELNRYFDAMDTKARLDLKADDALAKVDDRTYHSNDLADLDEGVLKLKAVEPNQTTKQELGYGKVLTVNAKNENYKDSEWAYSDNAKKTASFTVKIMSPIAEGSITPATGSSIKVIANSEKGFDITADMITAKDYTGVTTYNIMPDVAGNPESDDVWESAQIAKVSVAKKGGNDNTYIKSVAMTEFTPKAGNTPAKLGAINVKAEPLPQDTPSTIIVTVQDAWGYMSAQEVAVTIATK